MLKSRENLQNILKEQLSSRFGPSYQWGRYWPSILWKTFRLVSNLVIHQSVNEPVHELIQQIFFHSEKGLKDWNADGWTEWQEPITVTTEVEDDLDKIPPEATDDVQDCSTIENILPQASTDVQDGLTIENILPKVGVDVQDGFSIEIILPQSSVDVQDGLTTENILPQSSIDVLTDENILSEASVDVQDGLTIEKILPQATDYVQDCPTIENILPQASVDVQDVLTDENILSEASVDVRDIPNTPTEKDKDIDQTYTTEVKTVEMEETEKILSTDGTVSEKSDMMSLCCDITDIDQEEDKYFSNDEKEESNVSRFIPNIEETGSNHQDLDAQTEVQDDEADEKDPVKSSEIVLDPDCLRPELDDKAGAVVRSSLSQTPLTAPKRELSRKLSFGDKIFQTVKRNFSSPGKNNDDRKKGNMKIILF